MVASKDFFVGLMMTEELNLREPLARTEVRTATVTGCYVLAALVPVVLTEFFVRLFAAGWCVNLLCAQGDRCRSLVFAGVGIVIVGGLGARRASMSMLSVSTHTLETVCLGIASVLGPKLVMYFLST